MTDMEQQQKEVRKKALKLLEHMGAARRRDYMIGFSVPAFRKLWQQMLSHM